NNTNILPNNLRFISHSSSENSKN
ncbi:MAG TPA: hypothetical protein ENJ93_01430, partial [Chloroflexi bacterium]|nr:hypothetical protein [Chloroflexota bacterium]